MAVALAALVVATAGSSFAEPVRDAARKLITGKQIKKGTLSERHLSRRARRRLRGRRGPAGAQGLQGATGAQGLRGLQGAQGLQGVQGEQGPAGSDAEFNGAAAGGALAGTYPSPLLAAGAVGAAAFADLPAVRVSQTGTETVANNVSEILTFDVETYDSDDMADLGSDNDSVFAKTAGLYLVTGTVNWAQDPDGRRSIRIRVNGSIVPSAGARSAGAAAPDAATTQSLSSIENLSVNDRVELDVNHTAGADLSTASDGARSATLALHWLGPSP